MKKPSKWYTALVTWLAIYPTITIILLAFDSLLLILPLPIKTLILTVVVVPIMIFIAVPLVSRGLLFLKNHSKRASKRAF